LFSSTYYSAALLNNYIMLGHIRFLEHNVEYLANENRILMARVHTLHGMHGQANILCARQTTRLAHLEAENVQLRQTGLALYSF
jgi:hypothetical protein